MKKCSNRTLIDIGKLALLLSTHAPRATDRSISYKFETVWGKRRVSIHYMHEIKQGDDDELVCPKAQGKTGTESERSYSILANYKKERRERERGGVYIHMCSDIYIFSLGRVCCWIVVVDGMVQDPEFLRCACWRESDSLLLCFALLSRRPRPRAPQSQSQSLFPWQLCSPLWGPE